MVDRDYPYMLSIKAWQEKDPKHVDATTSLMLSKLTDPKDKALFTALSEVIKSSVVDMYGDIKDEKYRYIIETIMSRIRFTLTKKLQLDLLKEMIENLDLNLDEKSTEKLVNSLSDCIEKTTGAATKSIAQDAKTAVEQLKGLSLTVELQSQTTTTSQKDLKKSFSEKLNSLMRSITGQLKKSSSAVTNSINKTKSAISDQVSALNDDLSALIDTISKTMSIANIGSMLITPITSAIKLVFSTFWEVVKFPFKIMYGVLDTCVIKPIKGLISGLWKTLKPGLLTFFTELLKSPPMAYALGFTLSFLWYKYINPLFAPISEWWDKSMKPILEPMIEFFKGNKSFGDALKDLWNNLWDGTESWRGLKLCFIDLGNWIWKGECDWLPQWKGMWGLLNEPIWSFSIPIPFTMSEDGKSKKSINGSISILNLLEIWAGAAAIHYAASLVQFGNILGLLGSAGIAGLLTQIYKHLTGKIPKLPGGTKPPGSSKPGGAGSSSESKVTKTARNAEAAKGKAATAQNNVKGAEEQLRAAEAEKAAREAKLRQIRGQAANARGNVERTQRLVDRYKLKIANAKDPVAKAQFEQKLNKFQSQLNKLKRLLESLEKESQTASDLTKIEKEIAAREKELRALQKEAEAAEKEAAEAIRKAEKAAADAAAKASKGPGLFQKDLASKLNNSKWGRRINAFGERIGGKIAKLAAKHPVATKWLGRFGKGLGVFFAYKSHMNAEERRARGDDAGGTLADGIAMLDLIATFVPGVGTVVGGGSSLIADQFLLLHDINQGIYDQINDMLQLPTTLMFNTQATLLDTAARKNPLLLYRERVEKAKYLLEQLKYESALMKEADEVIDRFANPSWYSGWFNAMFNSDELHSAIMKRDAASAAKLHLLARFGFTSERQLKEFLELNAKFESAMAEYKRRVDEKAQARYADAAGPGGAIDLTDPSSTALLATWSDVSKERMEQRAKDQGKTLAEIKADIVTTDSNVQALASEIIKLRELILQRDHRNRAERDLEERGQLVLPLPDNSSVK